MTDYTYSIQNDFPNQTVNPNCLHAEILNSSIATNFIGILIEEGNARIFFDVALSGAEQTTLDNLIASHDHQCVLAQGTNSGFNNVGYWDCIVDANGNGDYTKISDALNDGNVSIFVKKGIYIEDQDIVIPKGGTIIGESLGNVVVVFSGAYSIKHDSTNGIKESTGTVSVVNGSNAITGSGTTFTNLEVGAYIKLCGRFYQITSITDDTNLVLAEDYNGDSNSNISFVAHKLALGMRIENLNILNSTTYGAYFRGAGHVIIKNCLFRNNGDETSGHDNLAFEDCFECFVLSSVSESSKSSGILVKSSEIVEITASVFSNNKDKGILVIDSNQIIIDGSQCNVNNVHGVSCEGSTTNVNITDTILRCNNNKGINSDSSTGNIIMDSCTVIKNGTDGIDFDGTENIVNDCLIDGNGSHGIQAGDNGVISGNRIINNGGNGFNGSNDQDCVITSNFIRNNSGDGIYSNADNNIITGNRVFDNGDEGIEIGSSATDNIVSLNNCKNNTGTNLLNNGSSTIVTNNES